MREVGDGRSSGDSGYVQTRTAKGHQGEVTFTKEFRPEMNVEQTQSNPLTWVMEFRRKLYLAAKERPERGFGVLYDKVCRKDVLMEAWKRVSASNGGCGVDMVSIRHIKEEYGEEKFVSELQEVLVREGYEPAEIRRVYIPKDNGEKRPLGIPTVKDRVVQMAVKLIIEPLFEADFLDVSYGYRPGRSNQQAVERVHMLSNGLKWVVDVDLKGYFDTIPHIKLMEHVTKRVRDPKVLSLIHRWLKAGIIEEGKVTEPECGTPQGGVLSPLLSNIYLHEFDRNWKRWHGQLIRFADDMLIMCRTKEEAVKALGEVRRLVEGLGLTLNMVKTNIRHASKGFDFLGFTFREGFSKRLKRKVMVKYPKKKSLCKVKTKLKELLKKMPLGKTMGEAIKACNPIIRGWVNYFRIGNSYVAALEVSEIACAQLRIFWRRKKQRKRSFGNVKWKNKFFYDKGLLYVPALI